MTRRNTEIPQYVCENTALRNECVGARMTPLPVTLRSASFSDEGSPQGHSRESGNPESLEVCLEIRSGSPIKEFVDNKESNRQECLFYAEKFG